MEQNQEKKYCARLGWALLAVVVWAAVWQFALAFALAVLLLAAAYAVVSGMVKRQLTQTEERP